MWRDSDDRTKPSRRAKGEKGKGGEEEEEEEEDDEEEDPFGLGCIMSKATRDNNDPQEEEKEEEEEDPFGLGAIMEGTKGEGDNPESRSGKRSSSNGDGGGDESSQRNKKAQKTTGGYFKGTRPATSTQSVMAEAKRQPFQAAKTFGGARQGYVFQKGGLGLGYYVDKVQLRGAAVAAAAAAAASRAKSQATVEARGAGAAVSAAGAGAASSGGGGGSERKPQTVDVAASLQKLKVFVLKPKKAAKAAALLADLMQAQMRPENARMFFRYKRSQVHQ